MLFRTRKLVTLWKKFVNFSRGIKFERLRKLNFWNLKFSTIILTFTFYRHKQRQCWERTNCQFSARYANWQKVTFWSNVFPRCSVLRLSCLFSQQSNRVRTPCGTLERNPHLSSDFTPQEFFRILKQSYFILFLESSLVDRSNINANKIHTLHTLKEKYYIIMTKTITAFWRLVVAHQSIICRLYERLSTIWKLPETKLFDFSNYSPKSRKPR